MDLLWIVVGSLAGLGLGILIGRSMAAAATRRAQELEVERDAALEHAAKIQRAADQRKAALQAAKLAESQVAGARAEASAAAVARDEVVATLEALEARQGKLVDDYRSEIAERDRTLSAQAERLKRAEAALEKAQATSAPSIKVSNATRTGIGADKPPTGRNGEAEVPTGKPDVLERELAKVKNDLGDVTREREESRTASKRLQNRMRELNQAQARLNESFADRNRRIAELEARLDESGSSTEAAMSLAPQFSATSAADIVKEFDEKSANEALVRAYRHDMATKTREIKALEERLAQREKTIGRLKDKLDSASAKPALMQGGGMSAVDTDDQAKSFDQAMSFAEPSAGLSIESGETSNDEQIVDSLAEVQIEDVGGINAEAGTDDLAAN